ncbi:neck protein [uncultured Mediterranean phage]|nr:neck protein [uncultured Mediterranean phage]|tara:strand:- start:4980 stop:5828 length:849 start_codon:yes stop_codon:yes gene_type:complete
MAQPASRSELITYCKRQLGAPVLEINVADEQIEDILDDAIQFFQERHFDGVYNTFLKYKLTENDIKRGRSRGERSDNVGVTTTTATATIDGGTTSFSWTETANYLQVPPEVIGVTKIFHYDGSNTVTNNMFSVKYQLFLNDIYYWGATELLTYAMTKTYLEDINFLLTTQKQIRFNQRQDRLYMDVDWGNVTEGDYIVMDCYRAMNPNDYSRVWNDSFLKMYLTALVKRQWGQNLMKFQGVKLPGGVELNGRQMYDDAEKELERIREMMSNSYELPPLDMIG